VEGYATDKAKYYKQLKARILYLNKPFLETLLIVYRFVIDGMPDDTFLNDKLKDSLLFLQKLNSDEEFIGKSKFKCIGISIPVNFKDNRIDMTENFYTGGFSSWKWEELYVEEEILNPITPETQS